jgi:hypothetical protein
VGAPGGRQPRADGRQRDAGGCMGFVRKRPGGAWVLHRAFFLLVSLCSLRLFGAMVVRQAQGGLMLDLLYIGITIVVFGVLWLLVKGVEHFER